MRTVQEMIHTEKCLESLPETAFLWEMGLLQSEQVRLLCRMGEPVWERAWAMEAQHMSVRQLAEWIQRRKAAIQREREELAASESGAAGSGAAKFGGPEESQDVDRPRDSADADPRGLAGGEGPSRSR